MTWKTLLPEIDFSVAGRRNRNDRLFLPVRQRRFLHLAAEGVNHTYL